MALPTLTKTWTFNCNNQMVAQGSNLADGQVLLLNIINALLATGKWTVYYSCNSTVAGTAGDGVNRWGTSANLVWNSGTNPHSWIVLRNTNIAGGNYQLCFDLNLVSTQAYNIVVMRSMNAGFTGGSTTVRPGASDQVALLSSNTWGGPQADQAMRWSTQVSTDGKCTRVIIAGGGSLRGFWYFEHASNAEPGVTWPVGDYMAGISTGAFTPSLLLTNIYPVATQSGSAYVGYVNILGTLASPNSFSLSWPLMAASLVGVTVNVVGYIGMFQDLWVGSSNVASGDSYPGATAWAASTSYPTAGAQVQNGSGIYQLVTPGISAGSGGPTGTGSSINDNTCVWSYVASTMQFVQVGQYVLPWNGGAFNLT